jgi:hypothetical protein
MLVIAFVWLALVPPFFRDGACTTEFDKAARQIHETIQVSLFPVAWP